MSWIAPVAGGSPLEQMLGHTPALLTRYRAFHQALWQDGPVPRRILALCRLRIAAIHGCEAEWQVRDPDAGIDQTELYAEFWQRGVAPVTLKEMTRLRNARVTDCGY